MNTTLLSSPESLGAIYIGSAKPPREWAMITAYFDESGTHDGSKAVAFGGYVGMDPEWFSLSLQWRLCLEKHGIVGRFHMSEFESRKGQFAQLADDQRLSLISSLSQIIVKHDVSGYAAFIDPAKYNALVGSKKQFGKYADPYFMLMMQVMAECVLAHVALQREDKLLFVFDRKAGFIELADSVFEAMRTAHPWTKDHVSDQIVFASSEAQIPLQAADILAYETYKRSLNPDKAERKLYTVLKPTFGTIRVIPDEFLADFNIERTVIESMARRRASETMNQ